MSVHDQVHAMNDAVRQVLQRCTCNQINWTVRQSATENIFPTSGAILLLTADGDKAGPPDRSGKGSLRSQEKQIRDSRMGGLRYSGRFNEKAPRARMPLKTLPPRLLHDQVAQLRALWRRPGLGATGRTCPHQAQGGSPLPRNPKLQWSSFVSM